MKNLTNRIQELNEMKILSFDAETNGLWGQAFSIATVVYDTEGVEIDRFLGRCPIEEEVNSWVAENVLPQMKEIEETHESYEALLKDFFEFAQKYYKNNAKVLSHMGHIVEAKLLQDAHRLGIIGDWDAPYEWLDVCLLFGDSVDSYNKTNNIEITDVVGGTHNPLYDSVAAYKAFKHFVSE